MGWASVPNPDWAHVLPAAWNNANAGMPAEWQLRYLANIDLFDERPWIQDKDHARCTPCAAPPCAPSWSSINTQYRPV